MTLPTAKSIWREIGGWAKVLAVVFACGVQYAKLDDVADDMEALKLEVRAIQAQTDAQGRQIAYIEGRMAEPDDTAVRTVPRNRPGPRQ